MSYRATLKYMPGEKLVLYRKMLTMDQVFVANLERCIGCGICAYICPKEAIKLHPAKIIDGKLVERATVDFDMNKCVFCGECVVFCPTNALKIEINGKEKIPVVEAEAFPTLIKEIEVDISKCDLSCELVCQESCPTEAIQIVEKTELPKEQKIVNVEINKQMCIFCKRCELVCPKDAIHVIKPIIGFIQLDTALCPKDCEVCVDVCPSKAIYLDEDGKLALTEEFCIYCGACQEVCPEKAIEVKRFLILHSKVKSGAWNAALEKLTSYNSLVKELNVKCEEKKYIRVDSSTRGSAMPKVSKKKFIFANPTDCTGCGACELICALEKEKKFKPSLSRIKVNRLYGIFNIVNVCHFCEDAPCVGACPTKALIQSEETGVIQVDSEKCNGCGWCIEACDYGAITPHPEITSVLICDLCNGDPKCVEWCPEQALELISINKQSDILLSTISRKMIKRR